MAKTIAQLQVEIADTKKIVEELRAINVNQGKELSDMAESNAYYREEKAKLEQRLESLNANCNMYEDRCSRLEDRLNSFDEQYRSLQGHYSSERKESTKLRLEKRNLEKILCEFIENMTPDMQMAMVKDMVLSAPKVTLAIMKGETLPDGGISGLDADIRAGLGKLQCIKNFREATGYGLKECKDIVEAHAVAIGNPKFQKDFQKVPF